MSEASLAPGVRSRSTRSIPTGRGARRATPNASSTPSRDRGRPRHVLRAGPLGGVAARDRPPDRRRRPSGRPPLPLPRADAAAVRRRARRRTSPTGRRAIVAATGRRPAAVVPLSVRRRPRRRAGARRARGRSATATCTGTWSSRTGKPWRTGEAIADDCDRRRAARTATAPSCCCTPGPGGTGDAVGPDRSTACAALGADVRDDRRTGDAAVSRRPAILAVDGGGSKIDAVLLRTGRHGARRRPDRPRATSSENGGDDAHAPGRSTPSWPRVPTPGSSPTDSRSPTSASTASPAPTCPVDDRRIARWLRARGRHRPTTSSATTRSRCCGPGTDRDLGRGRRLRVRHQLLRRGARRPDHAVPRGRADLRRLGRRRRTSAERGCGTRSAPRTAAARRPRCTRRVPRALRAPTAHGRCWRPSTSAGSTTTRIAELAPVVFEAATDGDADRAEHRRPAGRRDRGAWRGTAIQRLRMTAARRATSCSGGGDLPQRRRGVLRADRRRASTRWRPRRSITVLTAPPVIGAALLGLDRLGAARSAAQRRARRCLDPRTAHRPHSPATEGASPWPRSSSTASRKVFGNDVIAVNDVSLEIGDGEFMVLVGPSGCGKSTILRILAGLEEVTAGRDLRSATTQVTDLPPKDRDIAMVFQNYALYPHMTVEQNLGFGLKLRKTPKAEQQRRVDGRREDPRARTPDAAQARRALGRTAPARGDGPGDGARARGVPDGRAAVEPRREAPRADACRALAAPRAPAAPRRSTSRTTRSRR